MSLRSPLSRRTVAVTATAGLLLTGYRQRWPRLWQGWRYLLSASLLLSLLWQGAALWQGEQADSPLPVLLLLFDLLALTGLQRWQRLRDCFHPARQNI